MALGGWGQYPILCELYHGNQKSKWKFKKKNSITLVVRLFRDRSRQVLWQAIKWLEKQTGKSDCVGRWEVGQKWIVPPPHLWGWDLTWFEIPASIREASIQTFFPAHPYVPEENSKTRYESFKSSDQEYRVIFDSKHLWMLYQVYVCVQFHDWWPASVEHSPLSEP